MDEIRLAVVVIKPVGTVRGRLARPKICRRRGAGKFRDRLHHPRGGFEPVVAGESFACTMTIDVAMKGQPRMKMTELCVYRVKDGKIISEEFYS